MRHGIIYYDLSWIVPGNLAQKLLNEKYKSESLRFEQRTCHVHVTDVLRTDVTTISVSIRPCQPASCQGRVS